MMRGAAIVLKISQTPSTATPMKFWNAYPAAPPSDEFHRKLWSVMKLINPPVTSEAAPQPSGQSRTPNMFIR